VERVGEGGHTRWPGRWTAAGWQQMERIGARGPKNLHLGQDVEVFIVSSKALLYDISTIDFNKVVADIEAIRKVNPQRYEMEQLTAVVYESLEEQVCIGYKDIATTEFWVRGHMPRMPLMPGVVMLEAAAQISAYFAQKYDCLGAKMIGFGGLEDVRFRKISA